MTIKNVDFKKTSGKDAKKMIKELEGKLNSQIMDEKYIEVYELNNGTALMYFDTHGFLFPDLKEVGKYFKAIEQKVTTRRIQHVLEGKFKYDHNFPSLTEELVTQMLRHLGLSEPFYDKEELRKVDLYVNKSLKEGINPDTIYSNLVAYIGEYIRHNLKEKSDWKMTKQDGSNIWEPYIVDNQGNSYNPFIIVYKELYEYFPEEGEVALLDHTQIEIIQYKVNVK